MRCTISGVLAVAMALFLVSADSVSAQSSAFFGGGVTIPTQDYGDFANAGWMGFGGLLFPIGETNFSAGVEGYYGQNNHEADGNRTDLYGALALGSVAMGDQDAPTRPFVFGGVGSMTHSFKSEDFPDFEESETNLAAQVGAGVNFALGSVGGMVAASATTGMFDLNSTTFAAVAAALQIPFGN